MYVRTPRTGVLVVTAPRADLVAGHHNDEHPVAHVRVLQGASLRPRRVLPRLHDQRMKARIVDALEWLCGATGHRFACRLAYASLNLDDRWGTQRWTGPNPTIKGR